MFGMKPLAGPDVDVRRCCSLPGASMRAPPCRRRRSSTSTRMSAANDPDGFKLSASAAARRAGRRGRPRGDHPDARAHRLRGRERPRRRGVAADSGGRLVAFCRVNPAVQPLEEARRSFDAGARGIKLHPRAEQFQLTDDGVEDIFAFAHERRLPVLIHAGRGIPALGHDALRLADRYPDARIILAHSAICDLAWVWRELPQRPQRVRRHELVGAERSPDRVRARTAEQPPVGERPSRT